VAIATPEAALPFNSQVPTVARVGQPYHFQFSSSTFAPDTQTFQYHLSNGPAWLLLDAATRTLSGTPSSGDVGPAQFILSATDGDGTAHIGCTLIVSKDPAPALAGDISQQLTENVNLTSSEPMVLTVLPSSSFRLQFKHDSFIDIVERNLYYYATMTDHTPLPSWLIFDAQNLAFSGLAPQLTAVPLTWSIDIIASDVVGFAGSSASFSITIAAEQLVFVPQEQAINIIAGEDFRFTGLQNMLYRNGAKRDISALQSATASVPSWLKFDTTTLALEGAVPANTGSTNVTVTVRDKLGDQASALLYLVSPSGSGFAGEVGRLTAHEGDGFSYQFPRSLFSVPDPQLLVVIPETAQWLHFNAASRALYGTVPTSKKRSTVHATLKLTSPALPSAQSQVFEIDIASPTSHQQPSNASSRPLGPGSASDKLRSRLSGGVVAAVVLGCLLAAAILAACLVLIGQRKRRRKEQSYDDSESSPKRYISRPILQPDPDAIMVTTEFQTDVEKAAEEGGRAPQIALNIPATPHNRGFKWSKRFSRISHASSLIGPGEEAIRADTNIPELGRRSAVLQDVHESFAVPAALAHTSARSPKLSPGKRVLRRVRKMRQLPSQSIGLGIDIGEADMQLSRAARRRQRKQEAERKVGLSRATTVTTRDSGGSVSTRGTSVLSPRASDFPHPPDRSAQKRSRARPKLTLTESQKRRSVRLVERSNSAPDDRSLHEKRQSYIRNRASATLASPLFANGPRISTLGGKSVRGSLNGISAGEYRESKRGSSKLTIYSESSSIEPPPRDPRRLSARLRTAFGPNFPRVVTKTTLELDENEAEDDASSFYTTSSSISERDYTAEMALPRHQRSWVLPGEASPTPPPETLRARGGMGTRQREVKARHSVHRSSPLSTGAAGAASKNLAEQYKAKKTRRSKLGEPMDLVSNDSLSRAKPARSQDLPPAAFEQPKTHGLSNLRQELEDLDTEDTRPGSEMFEALEGAGLMPPSISEGRDFTAKSNASGPAFI